MGDVNGDGFDDMIFAYIDLTQGAPAIRTTAVLDGMTGSYLPAHDHPDPSQNSTNLWGSAICVIGDLDGDGSDEYAVGDRNSNHVYVYWGNAPATVFNDNILCVIEQLDPPSNPGSGWNPHFGWSVSRAGDMNADGVPDLLIGDATVQTGGGDDVRIGAVYVISGFEMKEAWKAANDANDSTLRHLRSSVNIGKNHSRSANDRSSKPGRASCGRHGCHGRRAPRHPDHGTARGLDSDRGTRLPRGGLALLEPRLQSTRPHVLGARCLHAALECVAELRDQY